MVVILDVSLKMSISLHTAKGRVIFCQLGELGVYVGGDLKKEALVGEPNLNKPPNWGGKH